MLRYIKHTINHALFYKCDEELQVKGFSDADWASSKEDSVGKSVPPDGTR